MIVCGLGAAGVGRLSAPLSPSQRMASAATAFLGLLGDDLRKSAVFELDSKVRTDWHYIPRERSGVHLGQLSGPQLTAVHALLQSALSSRGYLKTTGIMQLEDILREIEMARGSDGKARNPGNYVVAIFGDPDRDSVWGWKFEGHHISLNFTAGTGPAREEPVSATPSFLGSNPARVPSGPHAGWRVLGAEEDLGRELFLSLTEGQRKESLLSETAPADVVLSPGREHDLLEARGVIFSSLDARQQEMLVRLIHEYVDNLQHDMAHEQMERIEKQGLATVRFAWAGSAEEGKGHYYRIHGPAFVIELDNTQNDANHVHACWHDLERDFGVDLLKAHYEHDHR